MYSALVHSVKRNPLRLLLAIALLTAVYGGIGYWWYSMDEQTKADKAHKRGPNIRD